MGFFFSRLFFILKKSYLDAQEHIEKRDVEYERNKANVLPSEDHRPDSSKVQYMEEIPDYSNRQTTNTLSKLGYLTNI